MTGSTDQNTPSTRCVELPAALADYADRLLLGTGLDAAACGAHRQRHSWTRQPS